MQINALLSKVRCGFALCVCLCCCAQSPLFAQLAPGDAAPLDPIELLSSTPNSGVDPLPLAEDEEPLPPQIAKVLNKKYPESVEDLRVIQNQVQSILDRALAATVGIELGDWTGSGVVVSEDGLVLTAGHVVGMPDARAEFVFADGRRAEGKVLGINRQLDCGMMRITKPEGPWPFVPISRPGTLAEGQWVVATGQPGGIDPGRSPPVRLGRVLHVDDDIINTDCTLVGGDSGGPLLDLRGRLVGIHIRIGEKITSNFHVPIAAYLADWKRLLAGEVWGAAVDDVDLGAQRPLLGLAGRQEGAAVVITQVFPRMPADLAGIKAGDRLLKFDQTPVVSVEHLGKLLLAKKPGESVSLEYRRGDEVQTAEVRLAGLELPLPGTFDAPDG